MFVRTLGIAGAALLAATATATAQSTGSTGGHAGHAGHGAPAAQQPAAQQQMEHGHAMLAAPSGARSPAGMVMLHGTSAELTLTGDQAGATRPWRIHKGTCANDQGVVGEASAFPAITVGADGKGTAKATLPAPLAADGAYFVAVHASASDMKTIVACGALTKGQM